VASVDELTTSAARTGRWSFVHTTEPLMQCENNIVQSMLSFASASPLPEAP